MEQRKKVIDSLTTTTEIVMPNQTNPLNNLMGGNLLYMMDVCAAIVARRHASRVCVTASVDNVEFSQPIRLGDTVVLIGHLNRAFRTSMEVEINAFAENMHSERVFTNRAYYTMVALDDNLRPVQVPQLLPETSEEETRFAAAERRRQLRLVLSGRLPVSDATELTSFILERIENKN